MKRNCMYIHGFASAFDPENDKIKTLSKNYNVIPFSYNCEEKYLTNLAKMKAFISHNKIKLVVGCSLGGFYALALSNSVRAVCIALNPSYNPRQTLVQQVGTNIHNYKTKEKINITESVAASYPFSLPNVDLFNHHKNKTCVYIEDGDDVINPDLSATFFESRNYHVKVIKGGNHRFKSLEKQMHDINIRVKNLK